MEGNGSRMEMSDMSLICPGNPKRHLGVEHFLSFVHKNLSRGARHGSQVSPIVQLIFSRRV